MMASFAYNYIYTFSFCTKMLGTLPSDLCPVLYCGLQFFHRWIILLLLNLFHHYRDKKQKDHFMIYFNSKES